MSYVSPINGELIENRFIRGMFMFGQLLDCSEEGRTSVGNGAQLTSGTWELFEPTITFKDTYEIEVCGIKMKLFHAPSEAEDEMAVELVILEDGHTTLGEIRKGIFDIKTPNKDVCIGSVQAHKDTCIPIMLKQMTASEAQSKGLLQATCDIASIDQFFSYFDDYTVMYDLKFLYE